MKTDITKDALRLVAVILLIIIIIMDDFPFYEKMKDATTQLFLGVLVVAFIFYDTVFGFIMGLVVMLIYYEIYKKIISKQEEKQNIQEISVDNGYVITPVGPSSFMGAHDYDVEGSLGLNTHYDTHQPMHQPMYQPMHQPMQSSDCIPLKMDYISEAHLLAAQNNIFDVQNYKIEVKGVEHGLNDEKVYGVQGFDSEKVNHKGYSKSENIYAILSDEK